MDKICTIAITVWNSPAITARCLDSLVLNTAYPHKILIIDNGSSEETAGFLRRFCGGKNNCLLKRFDENAGYLAAANFALTTADTPYICLLNNDTVLTGGWLDEPISILESRDDIGIVSPTTNEVIKKFRKLPGKFIEVNSCLGSCFILKKEVIDKIGRFDPVYGRGYFEEVDYCFRAQAAGFKSALALGAYIEHIGNVSFGAFPEERDKLWHKNRDIFEARWGKSERILVFLNKRYGEETLSKARRFLLKKCRARAIVDLYSKRVPEWAEGLHFNIRPKHFPLINFLALYLMVALKKKAYNTVVTDVYTPSFIRALLKRKLSGFCDFSRLEALYTDADSLGDAVKDGSDGS